MAKSKKRLMHKLMIAEDKANDWLHEHVERPLRHNRKVKTAVKVGALAVAGGILYKILTRKK